MRYNKFCFLALAFIFMFLPVYVEGATTTKKCTYYIDTDTSGVAGGSYLQCTFTAVDSPGNTTFNQSCVYGVATTSENTAIKVGSAPGFDLETWFKTNRKCPKYVVLNKNKVSSNNVYMANSSKQVSSAKKKYGSSFKDYLESNFRDEELEDPNSGSAKKCEESRQKLAEAMQTLETTKNEWMELCSDDSSITQCSQKVFQYNNRITEANKALKDYSGNCSISKESDEYKNYETTINNYKNEAKEVQQEVEEKIRNAGWEELGQDVDDGMFNDPELDCPDIINMEEGKLGWLLNTILNYIRIIGPVLVVLLSAIDFIRAVLGTDEKAMKEAQNKLIIRLVAAVALFLVPTLVQLLLSFINASTCTVG